jgi:bifunctional non-homologous end joining protein LigD
VARNLTTYNTKRNPAKTPEPFGNAKAGNAPIFVVQRHDARRLHYDFRLEMDGALASWAVPKGVPLEPGQQHLAVHVEDHPLEYARFEGTIPAGNYGAGEVEIWDHGTFELVERKRDGGLTVRLHGERLEGTWALVPAHLSGDEKNWLIVRKRDPEAAVAPTGERRDYKAMLATLTDELPQGTDWLYEVKWDGFRTLARVLSNEATLLSRNDKSFNERFAAVAKALPHALRTPDCVLDGEVCALDDKGRASFSAMQQGSAQLVYYVFDLLELEGVPLVDLPLTERRAKLEALLIAGNRHVRLSESFEDGAALFEAAKDAGLEGIMCKRPGSRYQEGKRSRDWLKLKTRNRQEFVVCGWTKGQGRRAGSFGALVLGVRRGEQLAYVGNCGTGFTEKEIQRVLAKLRPLERKTSPFPVVPKMPRVRKGDVVWVKPELVCEVEFVEWTHDGHLRAPSYQGMRDDKEAEDVKRETPVATERRKGNRTLKLTNLDKPFWAEEGITKGDLIAYYEAVAPVLIPHIKDRPFTMKRYPDGWNGPHFFQKDAPKHMPDWIPTVPVVAVPREKPRTPRNINMAVVNDELALLWMVNMGCIDMNTWYSRVDKPERPDFVLFDLDPSEGVPFSAAVEVALLIKETLDAIGLVGFPKTSGSVDGLHVLVPIERRATYADTRQFAEIVAGAIARTHPELATTEWVKAKRRGVLIDANQNGAGKTIASVYSVRPVPGATVSTPLEWSEVNTKLNPTIYSMDVALERIRLKGDLFEPVLTTKQSLAKALKQVS